MPIYCTYSENYEFPRVSKDASVTPTNTKDETRQSDFSASTKKST